MKINKIKTHMLIVIALLIIQILVQKLPEIQNYQLHMAHAIFGIPPTHLLLMMKLI